MSVDDERGLPLGRAAAGDPMGELERQLQRGFLHGHTRMSTNYSNLFQVASTVYSLVDLLVQRGIVSVEEVEGQVRYVQQRLATSEFGAGLQFTMARDADDKYDDATTVAVDCENRIHLCRGACCSLDVALSQQDVQEGVLRWDLGRPYYLRRSADTYCCHLDRGSGRCGVYGQRPNTCRAYTCRNDERIWKDFAARIPNEEGIQALLARDDRPQLMARETVAAVPTATAGLGRSTPAAETPAAAAGPQQGDGEA